MHTEISSEPDQQAKRGNADDREYDDFLWRVNSRFNLLVADDKLPLFTTDAEGLWEAYLDAFPREERQYHNCNACRRFIDRFGDIVALTPEGFAVPAIWEGLNAPPLYAAPIDKLRELVTRARVTGVFLSPLEVWGEPVTGVWKHLSVTPPPSMRFQSQTLSAYQAMAEKSQDFAQVSRALSEFPLPVLAQAVALLEGEDLYRGEKVLGPAKWLHDLQNAVVSLKGPRRANVIWRHVATAPPGFCHPRSSMIGTLLEDLSAGKDFSEVALSFSMKMNPTKYQRPVAPPSEQNIAQAEKLMAELGAAGSLERRFARLDEIEAIWRPEKLEPAKPDGVFGHIKPKAGQAVGEMNVPPQLMTWEKFARTVLPEAKAIELMVPSIGNFCAICTATNPDAPPILQWDSLEQRNPFNWYVYPQGSRAHQWGLRAAWCDVTAVTLRPSMWYGRKLDHQGEGVVMILAGALDSADNEGNGIFPETLLAPFHPIRATIKAYSDAAKLGGRAEASACGIALFKGQLCTAHVRVKAGNGISRQYKIDRWE